MDTQPLEQNKPDDHEVAELERELARSPRHCSEPAPSLDDSIDPPPRLASRTCKKIWATAHSNEHDYTPNSGTFLDSAFFSPEAVLPSSYLLNTCEPEEIEPEKPKAARKVEFVEEPPRRTPWIGLVASISVGMVIAGLLFPTIIYITRSTQSYVTGNWETEINRRVGQYEQIHGNQGNAPQNVELLPYNLAASSWQEMHLPASPFGNREHLPTPFGATMAQAYSNPFVHHTSGEIVQEMQSSALHLDGDTDWEVLVPTDISSLADAMLLVSPVRESTVRAAFGQNILLRDGRVFFRVLPGMHSESQERSAAE
jgi:hypothetical protein